MNKLQNANQGFTLIELLLYLGLLTIVISAIVPFAWTVIMSGQKSAVQQEVFNNTRYVSERLKRQIRESRKINAASNFETNLADGGQVTLDLPAGTAVINVAAGKVQINGIALNSNSSRVTNLTFSNYSSGNADNLEYTLTMTGAITSGSKTYQATTTIKSGAEMRN